MKYYLLVGERSGDLHASNLMHALRRLDPVAEFRFLGGELMQEAGGILVRHYNEVSLIGFWEVIKKLRAIKKNLRLFQEDILEYRPNVLIPVDFGGFNMRIVKAIKPYGIPIFYYIPPKVWAWNTKRAYKIKAYTDRVFTILPFEKEFYKKYGMEVDYVGNPVFDAVKAHQVNQGFLTDNCLSTNRPIVALLPGSRKQEIEHMLPTMVKIAEHFPDYSFVAAAVSSQPRTLYEQIVGTKNIHLVFDRTYDLLAHARAALVTSGTATLETALWNVPQVVCYKGSALSYFIARQLVKVPYISLVNLIVSREVVKELIQYDLSVENLTSELMKILPDSPERVRQLQSYDEIRQLQGEERTAERTASLIYNYLKIN